MSTPVCPICHVLYGLTLRDVTPGIECERHEGCPTCVLMVALPDVVRRARALVVLAQFDATAADRRCPKHAAIAREHQGLLDALPVAGTAEEWLAQVAALPMTEEVPIDRALPAWVDVDGVRVAPWDPSAEERVRITAEDLRGPGTNVDW